MTDLSTYLNGCSCIRHYDWYIIGNSVLIGGYHDQAFAVDTVKSTWINVKRVSTADDFPSVVTNADLTGSPNVSMIDTKSKTAGEKVNNYCILSETSSTMPLGNDSRTFIIWAKENEWWSSTLTKPDSYLFSYGDIFEDQNVIDGITCGGFCLFLTSDGGSSVSARRVGIRLEKNVKILTDLYYNTSKWKMYTVMYDASLSTLSIYLNDILVLDKYDISKYTTANPTDPNTTISAPLTMSTSTTYPFIIGGRPGACNLGEFDGWFGDMMAFTKVLTYDEICDIYSMTIRYEPASDANLVYANFHGIPRISDGDTTVQFYNDSYGTVYAYKWAFGDGYTSTLKNPSHKFISPGTYTVSLSVTGNVNDHTETKNNYIILTNNPACVLKLQASTQSVREGELYDLNLYITSCSYGIGTFDIMFRISPSCLRVNQAVPVYTNPGDDIKNIVYTVNETEGLYKFKWKDYYNASGVVSNQLTGTLSNVKVLTLKMIGYAAADSYTIDFHESTTVTSDTGFNYAVSLEAPFTGSVIASENALTSNFSATPTTGSAPLTVQFTDTSTGTPDSWSWDFGDESALVTTQNPSHTYTTAGSYSPALTVTKDALSKKKIKTYYIKAVTGVQLLFTFDSTTVANGSDITLTVTLVEVTKGIAGFSIVCGFSNASMSDMYNFAFPDCFQTHDYSTLSTGEFSITASNIDSSLTGLQQNVQLFTCSVGTYQSGTNVFRISELNTSISDTEGSVYATLAVPDVSITIT